LIDTYIHKYIHTYIHTCIHAYDNKNEEMERMLSELEML